MALSNPMDSEVRPDLIWRIGEKNKLGRAEVAGRCDEGPERAWYEWADLQGSVWKIKGNQSMT